uniref:Retrotransposon gag domain-containing protein n=1 Tax=Bombyx mori TaxID=7091 RepID=A0A8R2R5T3_BOMMO|nr:activity-regulated cytoskeleton associated protein 2 [Bombyx mori]
MYATGAAGESLDAFLDAAEAYRDCSDISEENAIRGLSVLLCGDAAVWWLGVKSSIIISSWCDAVSALRDAFGDRRPPHRINAQLFKRGQQNDERTDRFIAATRALLAKLPAGDLSEKVQLDMIYGLLSRRVRERLRRDEISSFDVLLQRARQIEDATDELR